MRSVMAVMVEGMMSLEVSARSSSAALASPWARCRTLAIAQSVGNQHPGRGVGVFDVLPQ